MLSDMKNNILTAKEWLSSAPADKSWDLMNITTNAMIEFAKLHVKAALKTVLNEMKKTYNHHDSMVPYITDDLGLKIYLLENIK
jgi:hypothetical protein